MPNLCPRFRNLKKVKKKGRSGLDPFNLPYHGPPPDLMNLPTCQSWEVQGVVSGEFGGHNDGATKLHTPTIASFLFFSFFLLLLLLLSSFFPSFLSSPCFFFFFFFLGYKLHVATLPPFFMFIIASCYNFNKRSKHNAGARKGGGNNTMTKGGGCPYFSLCLNVNSQAARSLNNGGGGFGCHHH